MSCTSSVVNRSFGTIFVIMIAASGADIIIVTTNVAIIFDVTIEPCIIHDEERHRKLSHCLDTILNLSFRDFCVLRFKYAIHKP